MIISEISQNIHENAVEKGFWDGIHGHKLTSEQLCQKLLLIISEVTEAMEADRKNRHCTSDISYICNYNIDEMFITDFEIGVKDTVEDELADSVIRIFDLAKKMNINLEKHIEAKNRYNKTRPAMHGKKY